MTENSTTEHTLNHIYFQWYDHTLFGTLLLLSTAIGIYFSWTDSKKKNITDEYFLGGKKMTVIPIAMSLTASHVSSVTLMSVPADVYRFGSMYLLSTIALCLAAIGTSFVFLPIFYELQLNSTYEYLKMRFSASMRLVCSSLFVINGVFYMAIVVYVPSLAYSQATGLSIYYVIPMICAICTFYTTIGGLKAVVWTDTLQFSITVGAVVVVFVLGMTKAGGLSAVFESAYKGDRLTFDFDIDWTKRETVVAVLSHWFLVYTRMTAASQECVLKFLSLPTLKKAQQSIFLFCFGLIIVKFIIVIMGLIIYALYNDCDPLQANLIKQNDQLVPFYVADVASGVPGLTGLFISGVFCTALSTLSASMNALSATIYQDVVRKYAPQWTDSDNNKTGLIIKLLVVLMGMLIAGLAALVDRLGSILPLAISVSGLSGGTFLGLFLLGILCPRANTKGAIYGTLSSTLIVTWLFVGAYWYKTKGLLIDVPKHLSTDQCTFVVPSVPVINSTISDTPAEIFYLYRISHYYYSLIGCTVCVFVGIVVSYMTKRDDRPVDKRLLSPMVYFLIKEETNTDNYHTIDRANHLVEVNMKEIK